MEVCGLDLVEQRMKCHYHMPDTQAALGRAYPSLPTALEGPKGLIEVARRAKVGRFRGSRVGWLKAAGGADRRCEELR